MQVHAYSSTNGPDATASTQNAGLNDMFLKLLTAQLKSQGPFDPLDPTQFVNELAQFNTLNEVMEIRQLLQQYTAPASGDGAAKGAE